MWLSAITYLWTKKGWVFVACMLDLFTREIAGCAIDSHTRKSLVLDALKMAEFRNGCSEKRGAKGESTASSFIPTKAASLGSRSRRNTGLLTLGY